MGRSIVRATGEDTAEVLALYRSNLYGAADWSEHYPNEETIEYDLSREALFVMKEDGEIIATISIDEDEEVKKLPWWSPALQPSGELSRLCVKDGYRNQGIARQMMEHTFEELRKQGCKSVHILVKTGHKVALQSYSHLNYRQVGSCHLFEKEFLCFEKEL